jgi:hypothetical protein
MQIPREVDGGGSVEGGGRRWKAEEIPPWNQKGVGEKRILAESGMRIKTEYI